MMGCMIMSRGVGALGRWGELQFALTTPLLRPYDGFLQTSSPVLPQTEHSPTLLFSSGLFWAQVPLKSLPTSIWRILINKNETKKMVNTNPNTVKKCNIVVAFND